ncbi:hypothetical protein EKJ_07480 [Qipengyuania flava]|uniref:Uncharacterized protein n=1 Tax=Qipengyuania flava TaxID=192812 RepID=A0A3T1CG09_9SPHN|nr:hypothetical protein EKJ_07480 [Qipengyuania flava]
MRSGPTAVETGVVSIVVQAVLASSRASGAAILRIGWSPVGACRMRDPAVCLVLRYV